VAARARGQHAENLQAAIDDVAEELAAIAPAGAAVAVVGDVDVEIVDGLPGLLREAVADSPEDLPRSLDRDEERRGIARVEQQEPDDVDVGRLVRAREVLGERVSGADRVD